MPGKILTFIKSWYSGVVCHTREKKDQQVAVVVKDKLTKLEVIVSSSPQWLL